MTHKAAIERLFWLFFSLGGVGYFQFAVANAIGIKAGLIFGWAALACWLIAAGYLVFRGGILWGLPAWYIAGLSVFAAWTFWLSSVPPYFRDDLIVHLEIPKYILRAGEWAVPSFQPGAGRPNILWPIYMLFVSAGMDRFASFIPALFLIATAVVLSRWLASEFGKYWSAFGGAALLTVPIFFRLSTTAYTDPAVMFFACAGIYFFYEYVKTGVFRDALMGSVSLAAGSAVKYNSGLLLLAVLASLFLMFGIHKNGFKTWIKVSFAAGFLVVVFCGPWWLASAKATLLAPDKAAVESAREGTPFFKGPIHERMLMCDESAFLVIAAPIRLFFEGAEGSTCSFDGRLNPFILIFGFASIVFTSVPHRRFLIYVAVLYLFSAQFLVTLVARYLLPVLPLMIFLSVGLLSALSSENLRRKWIAAALGAVLLIFNISGLAQAATRFGGWDYLTGRETKKGFLSRNVASYRAVKFANRSLTKRDTIYFAFLGNQVYYSEIPYIYSAFWSGKTVINLFTSLSDEKAILNGFRKNGVTHLLYNDILMKKFLKQNQLEGLFERFVNGFAKVLYKDDRVVLLELNQ